MLARHHHGKPRFDFNDSPDGVLVRRKKMQAWFEVRNELNDSKATLLGILVDEDEVKHFDGDEAAKVIQEKLNVESSGSSVRYLFVGSHMTYDHGGPKSASRSILDYGWLG